MPILPLRDRELVQIVDAALADVTRRSGEFLKCRPGCMQCCVGVFAISQLDALRLKEGLARLEESDPKRAARVRQRACESVGRMASQFPGDPVTGIIEEGEEAEERFADFANDEHCPALDPQTGTCDLYSARPMTCRIFGPPVKSEGGLGVCELCFQGATRAQIAACEMTPGTDEFEADMLQEAEESSGVRGHTIVAYCLART